MPDVIKIISDYGLAIGISMLSISVVMAVAWACVGAFKRWLSGRWISIHEAEAYVRKNNPNLLAPSFRDYPDLTDHPIFAAISRSVTSLPAITAGRMDTSRANLARDLCYALLLGLETATKEYAREVAAYAAHRPGLDAQTMFRLFSTIQTKANDRAKTILDRVDYPEVIWAGWCELREDADTAAVAAAESLGQVTRDDYLRAHAVLCILQVRVCNLRSAVSAYLNSVSRVPTYTRAVLRSDPQT